MDNTPTHPGLQYTRPQPFILLFVLLTLTFAPLSPTLARTATLSDRLAAMTLEQKVAQMFLVALYGPVLNEPGRDFLRQWQPGGAVLFVSNVGTPEAVTRLTNSWQQTVVDAGGVPMFIATDQEGGQIARLKDGFTTWPVPMLLTASGDVGLAYQVGGAMARELSAVGVNMNLAPVADLYTNLRNPVIGRRSFGSDPGRTGQMLAALIRGMQAGGVLATAKHFPGHGDTDRDSHTSLPVVTHSIDKLREVEFAPFQWTIAAGVETIMTAHIWFTALDPDRTLPASLSPSVVTGLLREEMRFGGLVMTDAIEMDAIDTVYTYGEASIMAIQAGSDIVAFGAHLTPNTQARAMQAVVDAVRAGIIPEARIDQSVLRILDAKQRYGVLDWQPLDPAGAALRVSASTHSALVAELFRAGTTIAYDNGGLLPIGENRTVAVVYPGNRPAIRRECEQYHDPARTRWVTVSASPSAAEISSAVSAAAWADVVVVFTENAGVNGDQRVLVNALPQPRTVAVALFSPYEWMAFPQVGAYLTTYSPLEPGVPAACALLFGTIPARGSLPVALDGRRDFVGSGASIAFAPTLPVAQPVILAPTATDTLAPSTATPTITPTREPLQSGQRPGLTMPPQLTIVPDESPTPAPTATPDSATAVALLATALPSVMTGAAPTPPSPTPAAIMLPALPGELLFASAAFGLALTVYAGAFIHGERRRRRYARGFIVERCPVCGQPKLKVRAQTRRVMGIADTRHTVRCAACHSVLREVGAKRWKYRVNPRANAELHRRYHNRTLDERTLRTLERGTGALDS